MTTRVLGSHRARPGRELPAEGRGLAAGDRSPRHRERRLLHYEARDQGVVAEAGPGGRWLSTRPHPSTGSADPKSTPVAAMGVPSSWPVPSGTGDLVAGRRSRRGSEASWRVRHAGQRPRATTRPPGSLWGKFP